jgi:hypothetical protein
MQNSFEDWQAATCAFPKIFVKIQEVYQPIGSNRLKSKQKSACIPCLQKSSVNSKVFSFQQLRNYNFNIIQMGEFEKY